MKKILFLLVLIPVFSNADNLKTMYWSYACDMYIYQYDIEKGKYKIYTRLDVEDTVLGKYRSFQLVEGELKRIKKSVYVTSSKYSKGEDIVDFTGIDSAILKSQKNGSVTLFPCDTNSALQIITEAEEYFKNCPKNVIKKCP
ncbi:MAG: hypothetical protein KZQ97_17665 [Candidatus Thiodiazotropha sp. (ex Dulcina madagascariensis)]|nr:hypothetical protein [Candidatus Thiodiazotropha sp. (ex Dulcina madagascariensis)]